MNERMIGVLSFDAGATFEEYSRTTLALLKLGFILRIREKSSIAGEELLPQWSSQQIEISKEE